MRREIMDAEIENTPYSGDESLNCVVNGYDNLLLSCKDGVETEVQPYESYPNSKGNFQHSSTLHSEHYNDGLRVNSIPGSQFE